MGLVIAITAIQLPSRLLLVDRIPAVLTHVDRGITSGCACVNPFAVASAPGLLAGIESLTGLLSVATAVIIMGLVIMRLTGATVPMRRVLWPVLLGAIVALVVFAFNVLSFTLGTNAALVDALSWLLPPARAAVPIGFLVGLLRIRMGKAAVADLVVGLHGERTPGSLEQSIADALHDPAVKLGYWSPAADTYVDGTGKLLTMPQPGSGLSVAFVERADELLGAIIYDAVLDDDKALLGAVSAAFAHHLAGHPEDVVQRIAVPVQVEHRRESAGRGGARARGGGRLGAEQAAQQAAETTAGLCGLRHRVAPLLRHLASDQHRQHRQHLLEQRELISWPGALGSRGGPCVRRAHSSSGGRRSSLVTLSHVDGAQGRG